MLQCVFGVSLYAYREPIHSHGRKNEVNCEPEVLTAVKLSTEGKGYYTCNYEGEQ